RSPPSPRRAAPASRSPREGSRPSLQSNKSLPTSRALLLHSPTPLAFPVPATPSQPRPAVVLLSGGLDSATVLAVARRDGFACHALAFDYGQRHRHELDAARRVASALHAASFRVFPLDLRAFGGSALTDDSLAVPKDRDE